MRFSSIGSINGKYLGRPPFEDDPAGNHRCNARETAQETGDFRNKLPTLMKDSLAAGRRRIVSLGEPSALPEFQ